MTARAVWTCTCSGGFIYYDKISEFRLLYYYYTWNTFFLIIGGLFKFTNHSLDMLWLARYVRHVAAIWWALLVIQSSVYCRFRYVNCAYFRIHVLVALTIIAYSVHSWSSSHCVIRIKIDQRVVFLLLLLIPLLINNTAPLIHVITVHTYLLFISCLSLNICSR